MKIKYLRWEAVSRGFSCRSVCGTCHGLGGCCCCSAGALSVECRVYRFRSGVNVGTGAARRRLVSGLGSSFRPLCGLLGDGRPLTVFSSLNGVNCGVLPGRASYRVERKGYGCVDGSFSFSPIIVRGYGFVVSTPVRVLVVSIL